MAAVLRINIVTNASGAQAGINQTSGALGKLSKVGAAAAGGAALAGGALVALGVSAFKSASDVQQSFGALESVFGKTAGTMKEFAEGAANSVGLAKSEYANLAVVLGSQLTNMGRSQAEAGAETNKLIGLGADLASTFGGSVADAVSAVSGVLKGETDPIERYGISIKAADINAQLAAKGLDKLQGAALKQATATAALELLTKQAGAAQGAFGREANTAAGQQERLRANIENVKAGIGKGLLPVATAAFAFLNTRAIPIAKDLGERFNRDVAPALARVGRFILTNVLPAARAFATYIGEKVVPIVRDILSPVITAVADHFRRVAGTISDNRDNFAKLKPIIDLVFGVLKKLAPVVGGTIKTAFETFSTVLSTVIGLIADIISTVDSAIQKIKDFGQAIADSPIGKVASGVGKVLGGIFAAPLVGRHAPLAGAPAALVRHTPRMATAGLGGLPIGAGYTGGASSTAGATIDARTIVNVSVSGAIDPVSTARTIRQLLRGEDVRLGRASTFVPASGWAG